MLIVELLPYFDCYMSANFSQNYLISPKNYLKLPQIYLKKIKFK